MTTDTPTNADRLAEVRAKRQALNAQLESLNAEGAEAAELAREEQSLADETALVAAQVKYGPIGEKWDAIRTRLGVIIVKRSSEPKFKQYQEDPKFTFESTESFARPCVEYPALSRFDVILKELPGVLIDVATLVNRLMGVASAERVKK
jgi:hypothetical protein